ncbi:hydroxypyruvate isomerase family protein [Zwartia vadi]|uniref:hydroxypyruvate isomerase family protein n=1 Tax=Zwartia vadi TaxID=3058168 RepID=UPI0025B4FC29|nr:TIM barrel protein [Zwartia vadi]MDN3986390.1 TIM barrel protein [Zwartia vadi]
MLRFSANLGFLWAQLPLLERIERAAASRFKAIELHWPYDVSARLVKEACEKFGLTLLAANAPIGNSQLGESGLAALSGRETEFRKSFEISLAWCAEAGAGAIHVLPGIIDPVHREQATETFVSNLQWAADCASKQGITILLEAINQRDKPNYFYSTQAESNDIRLQCGRENIKLMFDVYHVGVAEGDILTKLAHYMPHIGHIQIAAVPSRAEPDEGEVAYRAVFERIAALNYKGWIGCEYKPRASVEAGLAWRDPYLSE